MASVKAMWSGQCSCTEVQLSLCKFIEKIAMLSHSFFDEPPQIKKVDNQIEGRILLSNSLLNELSPNRYPHEIKVLGEIITVSEFPPLIMDGVDKAIEKFFLVDKINLYGIEFYLYDPRGEGDKMSFVFIRHDKISTLNGKMVMVEDHEMCKYYSSKLIQMADWYLVEPSIILRYYLERWFDLLMSWIKYFFVPGFYFWRWEDLPGYSEFKLRWDSALTYKSRSDLKIEVFNTILENFKSETEEWNRWSDL